jgi:two-component system, NarL family, response regulator LiaR
MQPVRILLAEDHVVVREGTREMLDRDTAVTVVGEAGDGPTAVELARELAPDVVLLDLNLPGMNGIEATKRIRSVPGAPRVLILSAYDDQDYVRAAMDAGASGYLVKTATVRDIVAAVVAVSMGSVVLHPAAAMRLVAGPSVEVMRYGGLTERELAVLKLAARGVRNKDIAAELFMSTRTVEAHFTGIFNKLNVSSRTEAVIHGISQGWLTVRREPILN